MSTFHPIAKIQRIVKVCVSHLDQKPQFLKWKCELNVTFVAVLPNARWQVDCSCDKGDFRANNILAFVASSISIASAC